MSVKNRLTLAGQPIAEPASRIFFSDGGAPIASNFRRLVTTQRLGSLS